VIQFDPKNAWAYCGIASVLYEQEKYDEALKYYHKAIKLDSKNAIAYWGTANALCEHGKYHESFKYAKKAYHLAPKNPAIKKSFAEINLTNERFYKAITLANEVLAEQHVPAEHRLVMRFILFSALLFQKKRSEALVDLKCFIEQYESLSEDHKKGWSYNGLKHFINNTKKLSETDQTLLLTLIAILESPLPEAKEELITLEFSVYEVNE
jgi:tetratricopeptide (TPR) repeat protein